MRKRRAVASWTFINSVTVAGVKVQAWFGSLEGVRRAGIQVARHW